MLISRFSSIWATAAIAACFLAVGCADSAVTEGRGGDDDNDDSGSDSDTDSDSDSDTGSDTGSDSDTDGDTDSDTDGDTDSDTDGDTDSDTGTGPDTTCPFECISSDLCSLLGGEVYSEYDCDGSYVCCEAGGGGDTDAEIPCPDSCLDSPVGNCDFSTIAVGHYEGGTRTICVAEGDGSPFVLALLSYEVSEWALAGAVGRVSQLQVYGYDGVGAVVGNDGIPTEIQVASDGPCDPYTYSDSMGNCEAHTGYAGCVFGADPSNVCHMELGLSSECSYPDYSCLTIDP